MAFVGVGWFCLKDEVMVWAPPAEAFYLWSYKVKSPTFQGFFWGGC